MRNRERNLEKRRKRLDMARRGRETADSAERNANAPRGRQVTVGDVSAYALPGHPKCHGRGIIGSEMACPCATKRFIKRHPEAIIVREDEGTCRVYWPATVAKAEENS